MSKLDELRAEVLIAQAAYDKSLRDFDNAIARTVWNAARDFAIKAFQYQETADEIRASHSPSDAVAQATARCYEIGADAFRDCSRDTAKIVESIPSVGAR